MTPVQSDGPPAREAAIGQFLRRFVQIEPEEVAPIILGMLFYFFLLTGYYILRPIRETFGISRGLGDLPALFYGTVGVMVLINPLYSRLVAKVPRSRFIPIVYRGLILCLLVFFAGLHLLDSESVTTLKYAFYIFISVFNLFIVSIFWSLMSDLFNKRQAARVYGLLAVGGSLGGIAGPFITSTFVDDIGTANLLLISCAMLELALRCALSFNRRFAEPTQRVAESERKLVAGHADVALGGSAWAGVRAVFSSPYLFGIGLYVLLYGLTGTFAYFFQAAVIDASAADSIEQTQFFAGIDLYTNLVTLVFQAFLFSRMLKWLGPATLLCILPVYSALGFFLLSSGYIPEGSLLLTFAIFQVLRRAIGYGLKKPTQELLFTVVSPEEKYKAKNLIDLAFARTGDMLGAKTDSLLRGAGLGMLALAGVAAPISLVWMLAGLGLGLGYKKRVASATAADQNA